MYEPPEACDIEVEPPEDFAPLQLPLAVQLVGLFVAFHVSVELLPVPTLDGLADIETTGALLGPPLETLTVVDALSLPHALLQVIVNGYDPAVFSVGVAAVPPVVVLEPLQLPLAVQEVALLATVQVRFEVLPAVMDIGFALSVTTGAGGLFTVNGTLFA